MPLEIRQLPPMRLAYMRQTGPYGPSLTQLWDRFGQWCETHGLNEPPPKYYGISLDNPACTPPAQCRYDACVQVSVGQHVGPGAQVQDFPGGEYACLHFVGTGAEIGVAWASMMTPGQIPAGWEAAPRPAIEVYEEDFAVNPATGAFPCWLCLAVQRTA
jgi:AraC family transcriptional regulator